MTFLCFLWERQIWPLDQFDILIQRRIFNRIHLIYKWHGFCQKDRKWYLGSTIEMLFSQTWKNNFLETRWLKMVTIMKSLLLQSSRNICLSDYIKRWVPHWYKSTLSITLVESSVWSGMGFFTSWEICQGRPKSLNNFKVPRYIHIRLFGPAFHK